MVRGKPPELEKLSQKAPRDHRKHQKSRKNWLALLIHHAISISLSSPIQKKKLLFISTNHHSSSTDEKLTETTSKNHPQNPSGEPKNWCLGMVVSFHRNHKNRKDTNLPSTAARS